MNDPKPLMVLWSKAAVTAAGSEIPALQAEVMKECSDVASQARQWFLHAIRRYGKDACYVCTGDEQEDKWKIFVQTARFKPLAPIRDDHPDPERRGKVAKFPEADRAPDNEVFAPFEDLNT